MLALVETRWGVRTEADDRFFDRSQSCYSRWDPEHDPSYWHPAPVDVPTRRAELQGSGLFAEVKHRRQIVQRRYTRQEFVELIDTYSTIQSWSDAHREGFLKCMEGLIEKEFGGAVERSDLYDLCVATAG
jgi:hypothetical protein